MPVVAEDEHMRRAEHDDELPVRVGQLTEEGEEIHAGDVGISPGLR